MKRLALILGILFLFSTQIVSAEILISQPQGVYNFGDNLNVNVTLKPNVEVNDFFTVDLICYGTNFDIYKN